MSDLPPAWQKLSALSGVMAAILVPLALGFAGNQVSKAVKEREVQAHFVDLAVSILREPPQGGEADSIRSWATEILSMYSGVKMDPGAKHALQHTTQLTESRADRATKLERAGFEKLLAGDLDSSIASFQAAEQAYPTFHQVYEIARYLDEHRDAFKAAAGRRSVLTFVADSLSYGMPPDIKTALTEAAAPR